jgi:hypothetical protein
MTSSRQVERVLFLNRRASAGAITGNRRLHPAQGDRDSEVAIHGAYTEQANRLKARLPRARANWVMLEGSPERVAKWQTRFFCHHKPLI